MNLIGSLQQFVDPFDLDVFTPHIEKAIQIQLQRSTVSCFLIKNLLLFKSFHQILF